MKWNQLKNGAWALAEADGTRRAHAASNRPPEWSWIAYDGAQSSVQGEGIESSVEIAKNKALWAAVSGAPLRG